jgi:hypothetical protein
VVLRVDAAIDDANEDGALSPSHSPSQFLFILWPTLGIPVSLRLHLL